MKVYVSILATDNFLPGIICLATSLKKVQSQYPFICYVTDGVSDHCLEALNSFNICYEFIKPLVFEHQNYIFDRFKHNWTKLRLFEQEGFSRLVYLDADMCVLKNMDELFELVLEEDGIAMSPACTCNPEKKDLYPEHWKPENCFFYQPKETFYGNAGLLVLEPKKYLLKNMLSSLEAIDVSKYLFVDQDFLNTYFCGKITVLSYVYNTLKTCLLRHKDVCRLEDVKAIHYILDKPWEERKNPVDTIYKEINDIWKQVYKKRMVLTESVKIS